MIRSIKRKSLLLATLGVLFFAGPSSAQVIFGIDIGAGVPIGDLKDVSKASLGGTAFLGVALGSGSSWFLKVDGGFWAFGDETVSLSSGDVDLGGGFAPIRIGVRHYFGESRRFFAGPNLGLYIPTRDFDGFDSSFGLGPQIGFRIAELGGSTSIDVITEFHSVFVGDDQPLGTDGDVYPDSKALFLTFGLGLTFGKVVP